MADTLFPAISSSLQRKNCQESTQYVPTSSASTSHHVPCLQCICTESSQHDCHLAINQLPQLEGFNPFHNGDPDDPFKLPMERTSRTCTVRVELRGSSKVASSCAQIVTSTRILNIKCFYRLMRSQAGSVEFAGGIRADITGRLFATLEYADVLDREGNLTSA